jgi:hypothetical protein
VDPRQYWLLEALPLQYTESSIPCEPLRVISAGMNPAARLTLTHSIIPLIMNMADTFDPYREALIVEVETAWPEEYDDWEPAERARVERLLHQSPDEASRLEYVRTHTGFCRRIHVTPEDLARVGA